MQTLVRKRSLSMEKGAGQGRAAASELAQVGEMSAGHPGAGQQQA
jgi:hypothetical protein